MDFFVFFADFLGNFSQFVCESLQLFCEYFLLPTYLPESYGLYTLQYHVVPTYDIDQTWHQSDLTPIKSRSQAKTTLLAKVAFCACFLHTLIQRRSTRTAALAAYQ